ncbi:MAG: hypothetical protein V2G45_07200 [bacterium JZ-2024 1]
MSRIVAVVALLITFFVLFDCVGLTGSPFVEVAREATNRFGSPNADGR